MLMKILKMKPAIWLIPMALMLCAAAIYLTVDASYLYGTDDNLFYFWRFGAFSLFGLAGGAACCCLPLEKLGRFWNMRKKIIITSAIAALAILYCMARLSSPSVQRALTIWLDPNMDPEGAGYMYLHKFAFIQGATAFGGTYHNLRPGATSRDILSYALRSIGIVPTLIIVALGITLIATLLAAYMKMPSSISKYVSALILLYFSYHVVVNTLSSLRLLPYNNAHFPFVSYNRVTLIFDLCLLGVFARAAARGKRLETNDE